MICGIDGDFQIHREVITYSCDKYSTIIPTFPHRFSTPPTPPPPIDCLQPRPPDSAIGIPRFHTHTTTISSHNTTLASSPCPNNNHSVGDIRTALGSPRGIPRAFLSHPGPRSSIRGSRRRLSRGPRLRDRPRSERGL